MVVLAVAAILLGAGVPFVRGLVQGQRLTTVVNAFFSSMNLARAEAIRRGVRVDMVPVSDSDDWAKGWVVFVDEDNNQKVDLGEETIFVYDTVGQGIRINASLTDKSPSYLAYSATGRTRTNASAYAPQFGSVTFELDKQVRKIKINFLGRARVCNPEVAGSTC
ncbi:hypothetical protein GCM10027343_30440 [Noviherbaspirillum agri]